MDMRNRISKEMIDQDFVGQVEGFSQQLADKASKDEVSLIETDLGKKAAKSEVRGRTDTQPIRMEELHTEVKTAMTGGSVPVVGVDAVGTENLKDSATTREKLSPKLSGFNDYRTVLSYENGVLNGAQVVDGATVLSEITLSYENGKLKSVTENDDGRTVTTELNYIGNIFAGVTNHQGGQ